MSTREILAVLISIVVVMLVYIPPFYLGWRFFYRRGLRKWAWAVWIASLWLGVGYVAVGIAYLANRQTLGTWENCPKCGTRVSASDTIMQTEEGEILKGPVLAWLSLIGGVVLAIFGLILTYSWLTDPLFRGMSMTCGSIAGALVLGTSMISWGVVQIRRFNQGDYTKTHEFKCPNCGNLWKHEILPTISSAG